MSDAQADGRTLYGPLRTSLAAALDALPLPPTDQAAVALAERYAHELDAADGAGDVAKLGPPYLAALTALGMTPAARKTLTKGGDTDAAPRNPLDLLAEKRAARGR